MMPVLLIIVEMPLCIERSISLRNNGTLFKVKLLTFLFVSFNRDTSKKLYTLA